MDYGALNIFLQIIRWMKNLVYDQNLLNYTILNCRSVVTMCCEHNKIIVGILIKSAVNLKAFRSEYTFLAFVVEAKSLDTFEMT